MTQELAGVVLAAGLGERLMPLTHFRPKALCPVNNEPLLDGAIRRISPVTNGIAVNVCPHRDQMLRHLQSHPSIHVSIESPVPNGTAGAMAPMINWIDGRDAIVHNADSWHRASIQAFVKGWDRHRIRLLVVRCDRPADFGHYLYTGVCLIPWSDLVQLPKYPSGLYEVLFRRAELDGRIEYVEYDGPFVDCGTPRAYLEANLLASGGRTVIGAGAIVSGTAIQSVIWPNAQVLHEETLVGAIRINDDITVQIDSGNAKAGGVSLGAWVSILQPVDLGAAE